ncbi:hypothetical protein GGX14DRAFT_404765 [Mycena pura]|uniref:F-box domain-containing protein n=1 Tax=Mycena pura TaxID=153505 RepID=A0AAD6UTQ7_9AGAR|nr:hypothetical protein GGX14DRAFT_404765 [Mycena pura]
MITPAAALRAQLDDIDKSMAALESQMTSLRAQKERLWKDLESLTYPVLTLPTEITAEIFLHAVSAMRQEYHLLQPYYGLLRLASVCQTWRAVTLSTCALWNNIAILDCDRIRDAGELLAACLPRAGSLPLDLEIWFPVDFSSTETIMSTLSLYASQWRRVHLSSPEIESGLIFPIHKFPSSLPLLERFTLSNFRVLDNDNSVSSLSSRTPATTAQLLAFLPHAPNLEYLWIGFSAEPFVAPPSGIILLPRLHTFKCRDLPAMVFQCLTLPALERLQLTHLSDAGVQAIQSLPTIRHLHLSWSWLNEGMVIFFTAMKNGSCLPALESLICDGCTREIAVELSEVVWARWYGMEGIAKFNSVSLSFAEDDDTSCADALDDLPENIVRINNHVLYFLQMEDTPGWQQQHSLYRIRLEFTMPPEPQGTFEVVLIV